MIWWNDYVYVGANLCIWDCTYYNSRRIGYSKSGTHRRTCDSKYTPNNLPYLIFTASKTHMHFTILIICNIWSIVFYSFDAQNICDDGKKSRISVMIWCSKCNGWGDEGTDAGLSG